MTRLESLSPCLYENCVTLLGMASDYLPIRNITKTVCKHGVFEGKLHTAILARSNAINSEKRNHARHRTKKLHAGVIFTANNKEVSVEADILDISYTGIRVKL